MVIWLCYFIERNNDSPEIIAREFAEKLSETTFLKGAQSVPPERNPTLHKILPIICFAGTFKEWLEKMKRNFNQNKNIEID